MKKSQKNRREFEKLKTYIRQIEDTVKNTKPANLWSHEASIRKKIKLLKELEDKHINEYDKLYEKYIELFDYVSYRLLEDYNFRNGTFFKFDEIINKDIKGYLSSGIISVLLTSHIPELVAEDFNKYFPANPKDEYEKTRKMKRNIFLHLGDTNTGKTYTAIERLKQSSNGVYLAPLRILALENFEKLNKEGVPCSLLTGEEEILVDDAKHISSTIEKLDIDKYYEVAVIDEIQMISNSQRGQAWTRALLGIQCEELHVCGALNSKELLIKIIEDCGDNLSIKEYNRLVPLKIYTKPYEFRHAAKGDALVVFSRKKVLELSKYFLDRGVKSSVIYGDLPPEVRRMQYDTFINGESDILITTDAIGMGVNLPIRRIIFMDLMKYDGEEVRYLTSQEVKQIGGRAGRKGIYETGYVGTVTLNQKFIRDNLETEDEPLYEAVLGPSEAILKVGQLPLSEKLALWSTREEKIKYYRKMDVRDFILILEKIKRYKLPESIQYRLMRLPFDVNDNELLECFINYVEEYFVNKNNQLSKPCLLGNMLNDYEMFYQKINLYYSFSKNFNIDFDEDWVYEKRQSISENINRLLVRL